jgi:uncharacterized protein (TIGR02145 family)
MKSRLILFLFVLVLLPLDIHSQLPIANQPQRKIALVIGNGSYISSELANSENDARAMKVALQSVGFTVLEYENLTQGQMKKAMDDFGMRLKGNDVGLFFYAGHGIQSRGYNYLIPVDAQLKSEEEVEYDCVQADRILAKMEGSGTKVNIIILDACRNNPFERSWTRSDTGKGLAFMNAPRGSLIAYATSPGSTASDGSGNNGLYTSAILESIKIPNITILEMFQNVRNIVVQKSNNQQTPWESTSLTGNFYFNNGEIISSEIQSKIQANPVDEMPSFNGNDYIIDSRDKQRYKTVKIGKQTWMAENLNYESGSGDWIYANYSPNASTYGRLYNWETAMNVCPVGWHLPTNSEWDGLASFISEDLKIGNKDNNENWTQIGKYLKSKTGWPETGDELDYYGFNCQASGRRLNNGSFDYLGSSGQWWSSTASYGILVWYLALHYDSSVFDRNTSSKEAGRSVRCIKD